MSNPHSDSQTRVGNETNADDTEDTDVSLSTTTLFAGACRRIWTNPRAIVPLLVAGVVVAVISWLRLHDPIPAVGYVGIQDGHLSVLFSPVITVFSRTTVPLSAFVGLKPRWLAWAVGLELQGFVAVAGAGAFALARLLSVSLTTSAVLRYAGVVAFLWFGFGNITFEGGGILLAIPLFVVGFVLLVRLFALPGLLITGHSVWSALRRSWGLTKGHGRSLFAVVLLLGLLNHLLTSVPVVGSPGSSVVAVFHAGTVAAFIRQTEFE